MLESSFLGLSEEGFHQVRYSEWGTSTTNHCPTICVHGLTRNRHDFDDLARYLSQQGEHVFCPDIVGRGNSDWLKNPQHYTYEQYLTDMTALMARTQGATFNWIGTSMGGLLGLILAGQAHSPIRSLVLNDIGPQIPIKGLHRLNQYLAHEPEFHSIEEAKIHFKTIYAEFGQLTEDQWSQLTLNSIREITPGHFISTVDPGVKITPAKSKLAWQWMTHPSRILEGTLFDIDLWEFWRKVTCPVLVIRGERSDMLPIEIVDKMLSIHPQTSVIEIKNAGHAPALLGQEIQEKIFRFLKG